MVAGWNALALVGYLYYNRDSLGIKVDLKETTGFFSHNNILLTAHQFILHLIAERMVRLNQVPKATVYKFENLSFKGKKDLKNESHQRSSIDTEKID